MVGACAPALADTVWMKNGDRLSGKIKVFDGGKLLLETPYGGSIPLDWKQVKTLESDQELLVKQDEYNGERAKSLQAAEPGKVILANGEAPKTVELASIQQIMKPKPVVEDLVWKGNVDLALDYKRGDQHRRLRRRLQDNRPSRSLAAQRRRRIQPRQQGRCHHHQQLERRVRPGPLHHRQVVLAGPPGIQARPYRGPGSPAYRRYRPGLPVLG